MDKHIATLEKVYSRIKEGDFYDDYDDATKLLGEFREAIAAIALMRGQSDMVLVPRALTAENGAKAALIGEFEEIVEMRCTECDEDYDCEVCEGSGVMDRVVPVSWTTIKNIHKAMVAHFHPAPKDTADEQ